MNRSVSMQKLFGVGLLVAGFLVAAAGPASASQACIPGSSYTSQGGTVTHSNLPNGQVWAGTIKAYVDSSAVEMYCVDLAHTLCKNECYDQAADLASSQVVWILNNYYPRVQGQPAALSSASKRARAVQLAVWHFTDGLDISTGGSPAEVFDAARATVAAAAAATVPQTPTTLSLAPPTSYGTAGTQHTVTATLRDQNGSVLAGRTIAFTVTGANPASGNATTDANGVAQFTYNGTHPGEDAILASVSYTIPIGLHWLKAGCQQLVMGVEAPGRLDVTAQRTWDSSVGVQPMSWGNVKAHYR